GRHARDRGPSRDGCRQEFSLGAVPPHADHRHLWPARAAIGDVASSGVARSGACLRGRGARDLWRACRVTANVVALRPVAQTAPAVAVVIPAFKQPGLLPEALCSVVNQEAEFGVAAVVVDDGCPFAETRAAALTFSRMHPGRICYVRSENKGL